MSAHETKHPRPMESWCEAHQSVMPVALEPNGDMHCAVCACWAGWWSARDGMVRLPSASFIRAMNNRLGLVARIAKVFGKK